MNTCIKMAFYNRPDVTRISLSAIRKANVRKWPLFLYHDGNYNPFTEQDHGPLDKWLEVKKLLKDFVSCTHNTFLIERPFNFNCDLNLVSSIRHLSTKYDTIIQLSDDDIVNPSGLQFLEKMGEKYWDDDTVFNVGLLGYENASLANSPELNNIIVKGRVVPAWVCLLRWSHKIKNITQL